MNVKTGNKDVLKTYKISEQNGMQLHTPINTEDKENRAAHAQIHMQNCKKKKQNKK